MFYRTLKIILFVCIAFIPQTLFATVNYLRVNHFTKELYWADEDHSAGWIAWETIPENKYDSERAKYLDQGYSFTKNPYLIEEVILLLVLIIFAFIQFRRKKIKRSTS